MSSDETNSEASGELIAHEHPWRSRKLTLGFRSLDTTDNALYGRGDLRPDGRGPKARIRKLPPPGQKKSSKRSEGSEFIKCLTVELPENYYDFEKIEKWRATRPQSGWSIKGLVGNRAPNMALESIPAVRSADF